MIKVYSKALNKSTQVDRIIAKIEGKQYGATLVFFAGIHGNETAGIFALKDVLSKLNPKQIKGTIYAISGNLKALSVNQRFIDQDLNRIWTHNELDLLNKSSKTSKEQEEQIAIYSILEDIKNSHSGPLYFIDFHTTSSQTLPFITINDALINRKFSKQFPVPIVLGIEEYLSGPLLSYINELGYVSLGFESGQHDEKEAITNCIAFIYLCLVNTNLLSEDSILNFSLQYNTLKTQAKNINSIFEVIYLHKIEVNEVFKMKPGFKSFQKIHKKTVLAESNSETIKSNYNATLFMPLYQKQGAEGFFIIRKIKPFFLKLSELLRRFKADSLLVLLPGISWKDKSKSALYVNLKVTRFLAKPIFHLLGYRSKQLDKTHMTLYNRERSSKVELYNKTTWYK